MPWLRRSAANLLLIVATLAACDVLLQAANWAVGLYLPRIVVPHHCGLLFEPDKRTHVKTHDYECHEIINSLGFRDNEVPIKKEHALRVLAIGDSFTYGWGVNLEDTWCKRVEKKLRDKGIDVEILNLGWPAAGPEQYARVARIAIPILKPDLIIVGILNGDDLQQASSIPFAILQSHCWNIIRLTAYLRTLWREDPGPPPSQEPDSMRNWYVECARDILKNMSADTRRHYEALPPDVKDAFLGGMLNPWLIQHSCGEPDYFMNTADMNTLKPLIGSMSFFLNETRKLAKRSHVKAIALSLPEGFYVNREAYKNVQRIGFKVAPEMLAAPTVDDAVGYACAAAGIPFCRTIEAMRQHIDETGVYLELDRHMSVKGNALYADIVEPFIAKELETLQKPAS